MVCQHWWSSLPALVSKVGVTCSLCLSVDHVFSTNIPSCYCLGLHLYRPGRSRWGVSETYEVFQSNWFYLYALDNVSSQSISNCILINLEIVSSLFYFYGISIAVEVRVIEINPKLVQVSHICSFNLSSIHFAFCLRRMLMEINYSLHVSFCFIRTVPKHRNHHALGLLLCEIACLGWRWRFADRSAVCTVGCIW